MTADRIDKVNQLIKKEICQVLQHEFSDPRFMFVTVTGVKVSRDLRQAKVLYSYLGEEKQAAQVAEALHKIRGQVRRFIGQRIRIRFTPELIFVYDPSIDNSMRVEQTLQELGLDTGSEELGSQGDKQ